MDDPRYIGLDSQEVIEYSIRRKGGARATFHAPNSREPLRRRPGRVASWLRLEHEQCANCPLDPSRHPACPAAEAGADVLDYLLHERSTEPAELTVTMPRHSVRQNCGLPFALGPLLVVKMAHSACPILQRYRPFLPALAPIPSVVRAAQQIICESFTARSLREPAGKPRPDIAAELRAWVDEVRTVVVALRQRIKARATGDAPFSALGQLLYPAEAVRTLLREGLTPSSLPSLRALFPPEPPPPDPPAGPIPAAPPNPWRRRSTNERLLEVHEHYLRLGTLDKAGKALGITRERVRQLLRKGQRRGLFHDVPKGRRTKPGQALPEA